MACYLVVAHQTAASKELINRLKAVAEVDKQAEIVLLVPATATNHLLTWVEGDQEQIARQRANAAAAEIQRAGLSIRDIVIGHSDPLSSIKTELARAQGPYAAVIISTLPAGISRWLGRDLPGQVRRLGVDVIHVVATAPPIARKEDPPVPGFPSGLTANGQPLTLPQIAVWLGRPLYCRDGALGDLHQVLYEYVGGAPVWLGIASKPLPFRTLLAPANLARPIDGRLAVDLTKQRILDQPHVDIGEGFASLTEEEHVYRYFGLPFEELRDIRVLRPGQPLPGSQSNWQNIVQPESAPARR